MFEIVKRVLSRFGKLLDTGNRQPAEAISR
jgi:hypothetical protein